MNVLCPACGRAFAASKPEPDGTMSCPEGHLVEPPAAPAKQRLWRRAAAALPGRARREARRAAQALPPSERWKRCDTHRELVAVEVCAACALGWCADCARPLGELAHCKSCGRPTRSREDHARMRERTQAAAAIRPTDVRPLLGYPLQDPWLVAGLALLGFVFHYVAPPVAWFLYLACTVDVMVRVARGHGDLAAPQFDELLRMDARARESLVRTSRASGLFGLLAFPMVGQLIVVKAAILLVAVAPYELVVWHHRDRLPDPLALADLALPWGWRMFIEPLLLVIAATRGRARDVLNPLRWWDPLESTCRHASLSIL